MHSLTHLLTLSMSYELRYGYGIFDSDFMVSDSMWVSHVRGHDSLSLSLRVCVCMCACMCACVLAVSNKALVSVCFVSR